MVGEPPRRPHDHEFWARCEHCGERPAAPPNPSASLGLVIQSVSAMPLRPGKLAAQRPPAPHPPAGSLPVSAVHHQPSWRPRPTICCAAAPLQAWVMPPGVTGGQRQEPRVLVRLQRCCSPQQALQASALPLGASQGSQSRAHAYRFCRAAVTAPSHRRREGQAGASLTSVVNALLLPSPCGLPHLLAASSQA